jgi:hypothetical protein
VHGPVKVPQEQFEMLVKHARRTDYSKWIRIGVTNCLHQSPGGQDYPLVDMWDSVGRWASSIRSEKQIDGVTQQHQAWEFIQRVRVSMGRAANDPALQGLLKRRINRFLHEALLAWDNAMAKHFAAHPEDLMTPDEYAGMIPVPESKDIEALPIFKKPPKPAPKPTAQVEDTNEAMSAAPTAPRPAQTPILLSSRERS